MECAPQADILLHSNDELLLKKECLEKHNHSHIKLLGNSMYYDEEIVTNEHVVYLEMRGIKAKFNIAGTNLRILKILNIYNFSNTELHLPNIERLELYHTNIVVILGEKPIESVAIYDAVLPKNLLDEKIMINTLAICTNKKMDRLPNVKDLRSNYIYPNITRLISYPVMDKEKIPPNLLIAAYNYINPWIYSYPYMRIFLSGPSETKLVEFTKRDFLRVCIGKVDSYKNITWDAFMDIIGKYTLAINDKEMYFIKNTLVENIFYIKKFNGNLPSEILKTVFSMITQTEKRTMIAKLVVRDFGNTFPDIDFEPDMEKIDIVISDRKIKTVNDQKNAIHARSLLIDRSFTPNQLLANRITHLHISETSFRAAVNFPNLISLKITNIPSDNCEFYFNFDKAKIKYLSYAIDMDKDIPLLGITRGKIDLGLYPNLIRFKICRIVLKDIQINNPNGVIICTNIDHIKNITNIGRIPIIAVCRRYGNEIDLNDLIKNYNIIDITVRESIMIEDLIGRGYKGDIKLQIYKNKKNVIMPLDVKKTDPEINFNTLTGYNVTCNGKSIRYKKQ